MKRRTRCQRKGGLFSSHCGKSRLDPAWHVQNSPKEPACSLKLSETAGHNTVKEAEERLQLVSYKHVMPLRVSPLSLSCSNSFPLWNTIPIRHVPSQMNSNSKMGQLPAQQWQCLPPLCFQYTQSVITSCKLPLLNTMPRFLLLCLVQALEFSTYTSKVAFCLCLSHYSECLHQYHFCKTSISLLDSLLVSQDGQGN